MNPQLNKIFSKLAKEEKTELASEKVELANIKELEASVKKGRSAESSMVNDYLDAKKFAQSGIQAAKQHLSNLKEIANEASKIESQAKALGLEVSKVKEWRKAKDFLNGNPEGATKAMIKKMESLI